MQSKQQWMPYKTDTTKNLFRNNNEFTHRAIAGPYVSQDDIHEGQIQASADLAASSSNTSQGGRAAGPGQPPSPSEMLPFVAANFAPCTSKRSDDMNCRMMVKER